MRAVVRELLEELRERMERDGRVLYAGRWRTREEMKTLKWQALTAELAWLRDVALILLVSTATVVLAYQLLVFLLFP